MARHSFELNNTLKESLHQDIGRIAYNCCSDSEDPVPILCGLSGKKQLSAWPRFSQLEPAHLDFPFVDDGYGSLRAGT